MRPTIRSYAEAAQFLERSTERSTGQRGTSVIRLTPTEIAVRYHNTDVVVYHHPQIPDKVATIDHGGWLTPTTAARINEYAPEGVKVTLVYKEEEDGEASPHMMVVGDPVESNDIHALPFVVSREHSRAVAGREG